MHSCARAMINVLHDTRCNARVKHDLGKAGTSAWNDDDTSSVRACHLTATLSIFKHVGGGDRNWRATIAAHVWLATAQVTSCSPPMHCWSNSSPRCFRSLTTSAAPSSPTQLKELVVSFGDAASTQPVLGACPAGQAEQKRMPQTEEREEMLRHLQQL